MDEVIFYLLDVRTSNALVLYKLASPQTDLLTIVDFKAYSVARPQTDIFSIVDFKAYLVQAFCGKRPRSVPEAVMSHVPMSSSGRNWCVHCAIF